LIQLAKVMLAASQLPESKRREFLECTAAYFEQFHNFDAAIALATAYVSQKAAGTAYA
jgi:hypothetical protein